MQGYNVDYGVPFCESFLCISSNQSEDKVVLWECIPESCKTKLIGFMSLLFLLSVLTTAFNAAVLVINLSPSSRRVFGRNATMRNYSNYVISMSVTDLLIGAVVLPLAIALFSREMFSSREAEFIQNLVTVDPITNLTNQRNNFTFSQSNVEDFELKSTVNPFSDISKEHDESSKRGNSDILVQCLGFFTQLGVFVSMYTLTAASVDRFYVSKSAASDPSHYISRLVAEMFLTIFFFFFSGQAPLSSCRPPNRMALLQLFYTINQKHSYFTAIACLQLHFFSSSQVYAGLCVYN